MLWLISGNMALYAYPCMCCSACCSGVHSIHIHIDAHHVIRVERLSVYITLSVHYTVWGCMHMRSMHTVCTVCGGVAELRPARLTTILCIRVSACVHAYMDTQCVHTVVRAYRGMLYKGHTAYIMVLHTYHVYCMCSCSYIHTVHVLV